MGQNTNLATGGGGNRELREFCIGLAAAVEDETAAAFPGMGGGGAAGRGGKAVGEETSMGGLTDVGGAAADAEGGLTTVEGRAPLSGL